MLAEQLLQGRGQFATPFNFGPNYEDGWSVERMAIKLTELWGEGASWVLDDAGSLHETHLLKLDASKARMELGWKPQLKTEAALEWTMDWYRAWHRGEDMREKTCAQISAFETLLH